MVLQIEDPHLSLESELRVPQPLSLLVSGQGPSHLWPRMCTHHCLQLRGPLWRAVPQGTLKRDHSFLTSSDP